MQNNEHTLAVIGLGYVGLPLAAAFGRHMNTTGFDLNHVRVSELTGGHDRTGELTADELAAAARLRFTSDPEDLRDCDVFIVAVPTPIDAYNSPDLSPLRAAAATVGTVMKKGATVVFESTVYPGASEEECVPILEAESGLEYNRDFFVGYSPERINPGDREHTLARIVKVVSGSTDATADMLSELYGTVVSAGVHRASSIRVAEAAKVIENTQRDLNIALVNELAVIFNRLGIDTTEVLEAAGTKWNFLPFRPGLVGGHCIGVDPYYLTHKAQAAGYHPEVILAGRRINDSMGEYVASRVVYELLRRRIHVHGARVLILGLTFKENCPDTRNTRVVDIIAQLRDLNVQVDVHDPWVDRAEAREHYGLELVAEPEEGSYDAMILAVAHRDFTARGARWVRSLGKADGSVLYDIKSAFPAEASDMRL